MTFFRSSLHAVSKLSRKHCKCRLRWCVDNAKACRRAAEKKPCSIWLYRKDTPPRTSNLLQHDIALRQFRYTWTGDSFTPWHADSTLQLSSSKQPAWSILSGFVNIWFRVQTCSSVRPFQSLKLKRDADAKPPSSNMRRSGPQLLQHRC